MARNLLACPQFINLASGSNLQVGTNPTAEVQLADEFTLDGRVVTLVDTPGFDDALKSDVEILQMIAAFLATTYVKIGAWYSSIFYTELLRRYEKGSKLSGVIYVHRILDHRFGGVGGRNFDMLRKLCGDAAFKNVVLVTNMWSEVSPDIGEAREYELFSKFFKVAIHNGARMVRHYNTIQSAHDIVRRIVGKRPVVLQIQRELVDEREDIVGTTAGQAINQYLKEQIKRYQLELEEVREEMEQALQEMDEETMQELEQEKRKLEQKMERIKMESERMVADYATEKERMDVRVVGMEQDEADRTRRLQANASVVDQLGLEQDQLSDRGDNGVVMIPIY